MTAQVARLDRQVERGAVRTQSLHADRPEPCRRYSCADDGRISKDIDRMELDHEWLDGHIKPDEPVFVQPGRPGSRHLSS